MRESAEGHLKTTEAPAVQADEAFPSPLHLRWAVVLLMGYFGLRLLFLATSISPVVPPDETTHFGICTVFSKVLLLPRNAPETYQYGLVTNIPWLYYWIMGKLLPLNFFGISDLVFLRLCNIPIAFALVYYLWRMLRLLTEDRLTQILLLAAATNTMMLTFMSAAVSYDNLVNLLAAMATYYLLAFFRWRSPLLLMASLLCQVAGCLAKITMLPLVLVLLVILALHEFRNLPRLAAGVGEIFRKPAGVVMAAALLVGIVFNLQLHGGNYLKYHTLMPEMNNVLPLQDAMQYRLAARAHILNLFNSDQITKEKAIEMTAQISHPGDRADAVFMIQKMARFKNHELIPLSLAAYLPVWVERMASGIFGILAHLSIPGEWPLVAPFACLALLAFVATVVRWRPRDAAGLPVLLAVVSVFYTLFLMYRVNYQGYLGTGSLYAALHGRYIFPVIGPIYVLSSYYLMRLFTARPARLAIWGCAVFIFIICDFPLFIARITPAWVSWPQS